MYKKKYYIYFEKLSSLLLNDIPSKILYFQILQ